MSIRHPAVPLGVPRHKRRRQESPGEIIEGMETIKKTRRKKNELGVQLTKLTTYFERTKQILSSPSVAFHTMNRTIATAIVKAFARDGDPKDIRADIALLVNELTAFEALLFAILMYKSCSYLMFHHHIARQTSDTIQSGGTAGSMVSGLLKTLSSASSEAAQKALTKASTTASSALQQAAQDAVQNIPQGLASATQQASPVQDMVRGLAASLAPVGVAQPANSSPPTPDAPIAFPQNMVSGISAVLSPSSSKPSPLESLFDEKSMKKAIQLVPGPYRGVVSDMVGVPRSALFDFFTSVGGFFATAGNRVNGDIDKLLHDPIPDILKPYSPWPSVMALLLMALCWTVCGHTNTILTFLWNVAMGTSGTDFYVLAAMSLCLFAADTVKKYSNPVTMLATYLTGGFYTLLFTLIAKAILAVMTWPSIGAAMVFAHVVYLSVFSILVKEGTGALHALDEVAQFLGGKDAPPTNYPDIKAVFDFVGSRAPTIACSLRLAMGLVRAHKIKTPSLAFTLMSVYGAGLLSLTQL